MLQRQRIAQMYLVVLDGVLVVLRYLQMGIVPFRSIRKGVVGVVKAGDVLLLLLLLLGRLVGYRGRLEFL